ncbi:sodium-dependent transporter [Streptomyces sp. NPDC046821]|uniref:bile acid:sodium symporter family protein n=1 Tax=Streptomyces sp. NPDC046821 TaxID=3154702 RepID=UPI0033F611C2
MVAAYIGAVLVPGPGKWARTTGWATLTLQQGAGLTHATTSAGAPAPGGPTLPSLLLAYVLFTAALQVPARELPTLLRRPLPLLIGTAAAVGVPVALLFVLSRAFAWLPDSDGGSGLLTGLALIGAMPVAGGATVWGGRAGGNHTLVVGLVLSSTLLSPLTIPLTLLAAAAVTHGHYSTSLGQLAGTGGGLFAVIGVVAPCLGGLAVRALLPSRALTGGLAWPKVVALAAALLLTYTNATGGLGDLVSHPDPLLFVAAAGAAALMCGASFGLGWCLARALRSDRPDAIAITLATGMNNSSASAVLAADRLADHPHVLLPVLAYSVLQKVLAGLVDNAFTRSSEFASRITELHELREP